MAESRASAGPPMLSGVGVGGLFEQGQGMVVEPAFGIAAWGVEEGSLSFGKIAVQDPNGHEHGFHAVAPVVLEELLECVRVAGRLPDGSGGFLHGCDAC
jgi:hypothetical protein